LTKTLELVGITAGGVAIATAVLWNRTIGIITVVIVLCAIAAGFGSWSRGVRLLPQRPVTAGRWLSAVTVSYVAIGAFLAAIPFYGAAKLPQALTFDNRGSAQILGIALAFAVVEVAKAVAFDDEAIEGLVASRFESAISQAYFPQLSRNGGPIPERFNGTPTDVYTAIVMPNRFDGWGPEARRKRPAAIKRWIDKEKPVWREVPMA
jgi:hypothetical protein